MWGERIGRAQGPWEEGLAEGPGDGGSLGADVPGEQPGTADEQGLPHGAGVGPEATALLCVAKGEPRLRPDPGGGLPRGADGVGR